jgi:hypothetical protein
MTASRWRRREAGRRLRLGSLDRVSLRVFVDRAWLVAIHGPGEDPEPLLATEFVVAAFGSARCSSGGTQRHDLRHTVASQGCSLRGLPSGR